MDSTALGGVSQSPPLVAQTGDVDADGEIVDTLKERPDGDSGEEEPPRLDPGVISFCRRAEARFDRAAA